MFAHSQPEAPPGSGMHFCSCHACALALVAASVNRCRIQVLVRRVSGRALYSPTAAAIALSVTAGRPWNEVRDVTAVPLPECRSPGSANPISVPDTRV